MFNSCPFCNEKMYHTPTQFQKPANQQVQQTQAKQSTPGMQAQPNFPVMPPPFEQPPTGSMTQGTTTSQQNPPVAQPVSGPVFFEDLPQTQVMSSDYTQGFLQTQIGKRVKITFLIGNTITLDRAGVLSDVGVNYVILTETQTGNRVLCDIFSIKFILFYQ